MGEYTVVTEIEGEISSNGVPDVQYFSIENLQSGARVVQSSRPVMLAEAREPDCGIRRP